MGSVTILSPLSAKFAPVQHGNLGVGAGVVTILSLPMMCVPFFILIYLVSPHTSRNSLLYDMAQERSYAATVLFELVWMRESPLISPSLLGPVELTLTRSRASQSALASSGLSSACRL